MLATFGEGQVLYSFLVFFFWIIWIYPLIRVFGDIFRSHDLSGVGKAIWALFVEVLPYLGVFIYLLFRGGMMRAHAVPRSQAQEQAFGQYVRNATDDQANGVPADEWW